MGLLLSDLRDDFLDEVRSGVRLKFLRGGGGDGVGLLLALLPTIPLIGLFPTFFTGLMLPLSAGLRLKLLLLGRTSEILRTLGLRLLLGLTLLLLLKLLLGLMLMLLLVARLGLMLRLLDFPGRLTNT